LRLLLSRRRQRAADEAALLAEVELLELQALMRACSG
jgi:hypothetical protein